jgi:hypothetical protein
MEYDIYGKVYKRSYCDKRRNYSYMEDFLSPMWKMPVLNLEEYNSPEELFKSFVRGKVMNSPRYISCSEKRRKILELQDELIFFTLNKEQYKSEVFDSYKIIKTIEVDREFRDGDTLTYNNADYEVSYKYNSETNKHELYISYTCEVIIDYELDNRIDNLIKETNELIIKHHEDINKQIKELEKEPESFCITTPALDSKTEAQSWFTKIINKIKGVE